MRTATLLLVSTMLACANMPPRPGSNEEGERFGQAYLKVLRWHGARESLELLAPEVRPEVKQRVKSQKLDDNLKITEYETKELTRVSDDSAALAAEVDWYVEPDVTVHHELITIHMRYRQGNWWVESVEGGPIPIAAPAAPAVADGGAP